MTTSQILVISLAAVVLFAVLGVFAVAYRRSSGRPEPWRSRVPREARKADQSEVMASVAAPAAAVADEPEVIDAVVEPPSAAITPSTRPAPVAVQAVELQRVEELSPEEAGVSRRMFFTRALLGTFGAYLGLFGLTSLAFLWPRLSGGFGSDIDAGPIEDLLDQIVQDDGSIIPAFLPDARAYVVPFQGDAGGSQFDDTVIAGGLTALFQRCVHLGCRVPFCEASQGFECPCHGSKYNFVGEYNAGPAPRNLDRFVVSDVNGRLIIQTSKIIQTARATSSSVPYPQGPSCIAL